MIIESDQLTTTVRSSVMISSMAVYHGVNFAIIKDIWLGVNTDLFCLKLLLVFQSVT